MSDADKAAARAAMIAKRFGGNKLGAKNATGQRIKAQKKSNIGGDDKRLGSVLKKMNMMPMNTLEACNMFKSDGSVIHIPNPKVQYSAPANTYQVSGRPEFKQVTEMLPDILNQLGPESMERLREYAAQMDASQKGAAGAEDEDDEDDDEVPDLVDNFEEAADDDELPDLVAD